MSVRLATTATLLLLAAGAAHSRAADGLVSVEQARLAAFDGLPDDRFGTSADVSGDRLVAGAPGNDDQGMDAGAVYAYARMNGGWILVDQIIPVQIGTKANFGLAVAIDDDTFVASAPSDGIGGAIYVLRWSGTQWLEEARLVGSDTAAGDLFGYFVAIDGDTIVAGAVGHNQSRGAAYVFERSGTVWTQTAKLTGTDVLVGDWFGRAVAISGTSIAVGAPLADSLGVVNAGAAYVFEKAGATWPLAQKILPPQPLLGAVFGAAAAIAGDHLIIAAEHDSQVVVDGGACFAYQRQGSVWQFDATLTMTEPLTGSEYGDSIAIAESGFGTFAIIGASRDDAALANAGAAYVYQLTLAGWQQAAVLTPSDPTAASLFGSAVAIDQSTVVVGSPLPNAVPGSVYVFVETPVSGAGQSATPFDLGTTLRGTIEDPSETDAWVFAALAGTSLQIKITGKDGLLPAFLLVDHVTGMPVGGVTVTGEGNKKLAVSVEPLAATGRYRLELGAFSNTAGTYVATTTAQLPPSKVSATFPSPQSDDVLTVTFDVIPGSTARLKASHIDQNEAPEFIALIGPDGPVAFDQVKKPEEKNPLSVTDEIALDVLGSYTGYVAVTNGGGKLKVFVETTLPDPAGKLIEGMSDAVEKAGKAVLKSHTAPATALEMLRNHAAVVHELIEDPLLAYRVTDRSITAAFKKSTDLTRAWQATVTSGDVRSLRFLPTEGVYAPSDFTGLDIPTCPSEPHTVLYLIQGDRTLAVSSLASAVHLYQALLAEDPALAAGVEVRTFRPAALVPPGPQETITACLAAVAQTAPLCEIANMPGTAAFWDVLASPYQDLCAGLEDACKQQVNLGEAIVLAASSAAANPPSVAGVTHLAQALRHDILSGRRVVVVAHGQGNTYVNSALVALSASQRARCGVVALASPIPYADPASFGHFAPLTLKHDAVLQVPGALPANLVNQWTEFFELPCANDPALCVLEDAYLSVAIHGFDLGYLGNNTSRTAVLGAIAAAATAIPAAPLLGQGILQVTLDTIVDAVVTLHVFEPGGEEVDFTHTEGSIGQMDVTHLNGGKVENYYVCQPARLQPGKYDVFIDNFEQAISIGDAASVLIRAGDQVRERSFVLKGSQDPALIPVARIKIAQDGTATLSDL